MNENSHEGWRLVKARYDDGGLSGGTLERPALQSLLEDTRARKVDVVVVYKVDRLTRSLADFAKLVELFEAQSVQFLCDQPCEPAIAPFLARIRNCECKNVAPEGCRWLLSDAGKPHGHRIEIAERMDAHPAHYTACACSIGHFLRAHAASAYCTHGRTALARRTGKDHRNLGRPFALAHDQAHDRPIACV